MALTRAERESNFRAEHGVSSGTYYSMRRNAAERGISPKTFDSVARAGGYSDAKQVATLAKTDIDLARYTAAMYTGIISSDVALADFYDALDDYDFPDDFDWWYH